MRFLGNIIWLLCGGLLVGLAWFIYGILWCITIVGIPVGVQCFKFAVLTMCPFGKNVTVGTSFGSILLNIFWIIVTGIPVSVTCAVIGLVLCCTVIGIPFGLQFFKIAQLALLPFGAKIE